MRRLELVSVKALFAGLIFGTLAFGATNAHAGTEFLPNTRILSLLNEDYKIITSQFVGSLTQDDQVVVFFEKTTTDGQKLFVVCRHNLVKDQESCFQYF